MSELSFIGVLALGLLLLAGAFALPWENLPGGRARVRAKGSSKFMRRFLSLILAVSALGLLILPGNFRMALIVLLILVLGLIMTFVVVPRLMRRMIRIRLRGPQRLDVHGLIREALLSEGVPWEEAESSGARIHKLPRGLGIWNPFDQRGADGNWEQMINIFGVTEASRPTAMRIAHAIGLQAAARGAKHELLIGGRGATTADHL